jgi:hypothetical protein
MSDIQWIARHLHMGVHNDTVKVFESLSDDERAQIYNLMDDGARMYLYTLNTLLAFGWEVVNAWNLALSDSSCHILISDKFYIRINKHSESFTLNRYGQMQLGVWVEQECD